MSPDKEWMTAAEVAAAWQISARQVQRMCACGELSHMRVGRKLRIKTAAVRRYEQAHSVYVRSQ